MPPKLFPNKPVPPLRLTMLLQTYYRTYVSPLGMRLRVPRVRCFACKACERGRSYPVTRATAARMLHTARNEDRLASLAHKDTNNV